LEESGLVDLGLLYLLLTSRPTMWLIGVGGMGSRDLNFQLSLS
jgi:hypothetical protein